MKTRSLRGQWSSRLTFILAATGSAVGLGNIWKFPYMAGQNGGGAFVLVYLICIFLVGIPIMIAEVMLGRRAQQNPINAMAALAEQEHHNPGWAMIGWSGTLAGFVDSFVSPAGLFHELRILWRSTPVFVSAGLGSPLRTNRSGGHGPGLFYLKPGLGTMMVYGSYLPSDISIPRTCIIVALSDTAIALLSGLVIFPIVFAQGMAPASGPGLIFQTLPVAFGAMPGGQWFAFIFFILLVFAA